MTENQSEHQSVGALVDSACDRFEAAWRTGEPPSIYEYVCACPEAQRSQVFRELLLLELDYRRRLQLPVTRESYDHWEEFAEIVAEVFAKEATATDKPTAKDSESHVECHAESQVESEVTVYRPPSADQDRQNADRLAVGTPRRLGDYELLNELGRGGMGVVYRARHLKLDRIVALKTTRSGRLIGPEELKRFEREARAAANLDHPGIVPVFEIGEQDGIHFLAMPLATQSLDALLKSQPLDPDEAARLGLQLAEAVAAAHDAGIIHRDLKPQNILLTKDGRAQVADFGLAKPAFHSEGVDDDDLTRTGQVLGTPNYMPPEQAKGQAIDERADVYSLGATLYAMLTAHAPFEAADPVTVLSMVIQADPAPLRQFAPQAPPDLEAICLTCLEKRPEARYQSMSEVVEEIRRYLAGETVHTVKRAQRIQRRRRLAAAAIACTLFALLMLPQLLTLGPLRHYWLGQLSRETHLEVDAADIHASWWGPVRWTDLEFRTPNGATVAQIESVTTSRSLWGLWRDESERGQLRVVRPELTLEATDWADVRQAIESTDYGNGWIGFLAGPAEYARWELQVEHLSCVVRPEGEPPQTAIRDWSSTLELQLAGGKPTLVMASGPTLALETTPSICEGALKYLLPVVNGATMADGDAELRLGHCRIDLQDLAASQVAAEVQLDIQATVPGLLFKDLLPSHDLAWEIQLEDVVVFEIHDRRIHHDGSAFMVLDPLPLEVDSHGSVGWDESLELKVERRIAKEAVELLDKYPMLAELSSLPVPIGGTIEQPQLDLDAGDLAMQGARTAFAAFMEKMKRDDAGALRGIRDGFRKSREARRHKKRPEPAVHGEASQDDPVDAANDAPRATKRPRKRIFRIRKNAKSS